MSEMTSIPEQKRPALHKLIDELPAEELELVERLLARLEMDRLWKETQEGFTQDWSDGKYAGLDEIIQEVRADLKQRAA
jgi:hypothetical protein